MYKERISVTLCLWLVLFTNIPVINVEHGWSDIKGSWQLPAVPRRWNTWPWPSLSYSRWYPGSVLLYTCSKSHAGNNPKAIFSGGTWSCLVAMYKYIVVTRAGWDYFFFSCFLIKIAPLSLLFSSFYDYCLSISTDLSAHDIQKYIIIIINKIYYCSHIWKLTLGSCVLSQTPFNVK